MATTTETAHTKIVTRLQAQVGSGLPTPLANVYDYHKVANLELDAVTVEPLSNIPIQSDGAFGSNQFIDNHEITISVRVHTSYLNGVEDLAGTLSLLDSVLTALVTGLDLGNRYKLMRYASEQVNAEFTDSYSVGAEVLVVIHKVEGYAN